MLTQLLVLSVIPTANSRMQGQPLKELKDPDTFTALYYTPPSNELPLLLYLHGAGRAQQCARPHLGRRDGTPPVELEHGTALPIVAKNFVVVAPQTNHGWSPDEVARFLDYLPRPSPCCQSTSDDAT